MAYNTKIFVYGTLISDLTGTVFPGINLHIKKREKGKINARLFDLGEYPGAKQTTIQSKEVVGEICEVAPGYFNHVIAILDDYEAYYPGKKDLSLYIRKITRVIAGDGSQAKAWVYWYNKPVNRMVEIESGDYKKYLKQNKIKKDGPEQRNNKAKAYREIW